MEVAVVECEARASGHAGCLRVASAVPDTVRTWTSVTASLLGAASGAHGGAAGRFDPCP
jgi:hypothetical protein